MSKPNRDKGGDHSGGDHSSGDHSSGDHSSGDHSSGKDPTYRIPVDAPWASAWKVAAVLGALGVATSLFGWSNDAHRFAFSWLFAFMCFLSLGLGALFFVLAQHLTAAAWGVPMRRTAEMLMGGLPVLLFLFVPIALNMDQLYSWMEHGHEEEHPEEGEEGHEHEEGETHGSLPAGGVDSPPPTHRRGALSFGSGIAHAQEARDPWDVHPPDREPTIDEHTPEHAVHAGVLEAKSGWLQPGFFLVRAGIYFLAWILLTFFFFSWSTRQDKEKGLELTKKMERFAPPSTYLFAFTLTFASVDWMMSMEPSWYSTMFGVIYWAISCTIALAVIILICLGLVRGGLLGSAVTVEHFHDCAKLLHGFLIFWAYVSFSQFMLIWYAGFPEESTYYHLRWWGGGGFLNMSMLIVLAGFVVPFFVLMSRNAKRNLPVLGFGAAWIVVMQVVQIYWLVMPYADQTGLVETGLRLHWMDISALLAVGGIYMAFVLFNMTRYPLVPVGDPRLARALRHEVV